MWEVRTFECGGQAARGEATLTRPVPSLALGLACVRCMKQGIECVMQTRGRGRPPRNMQEAGGASQPSTGRGSRSEDGQPTGVPPPPTRAPAQSAAGGMAAALHQLPSAPMGHMSARSIASSLSGKRAVQSTTGL